MQLVKIGGSDYAMLKKNTTRRRAEDLKRTKRIIDEVSRPPWLNRENPALPALKAKRTGEATREDRSTKKLFERDTVVEDCSAKPGSTDWNTRLKLVHYRLVCQDYVYTLRRLRHT